MKKCVVTSKMIEELTSFNPARGDYLRMFLRSLSVANPAYFVCTVDASWEQLIYAVANHVPELFFRQDTQEPAIGTIYVNGISFGFFMMLQYSPASYPGTIVKCMALVRPFLDRANDIDIYNTGILTSAFHILTLEYPFFMFEVQSAYGRKKPGFEIPDFYCSDILTSNLVYPGAGTYPQINLSGSEQIKMNIWNDLAQRGKLG